jgi:hypothetical protein
LGLAWLLVFSFATQAQAGLPVSKFDPNSDVDQSIIDETKPVVSLSSSQYFVDEEDEFAVITVTMSSTFPVAIGVFYETYETVTDTAEAGLDYISSVGTVTFTSGTTLTTFQIPILQDAIEEPDETLSIKISPAKRALRMLIRFATLTIQNGNNQGNEDVMIFLPVLARKSAN